MSLNPNAEHVVHEDRVESPAGTSYVRRIHSEDRIPTHAEQRLATLERVRSIGYWILTVVTTLILFRFVLKLFGANPENGFANFIYTVSFPLVQPFLTLFGYNPAVGQSVLEFPDLIAVAAYAMGIWAFFSLARIMFAPADPTGRAYE